MHQCTIFRRALVAACLLIAFAAYADQFDLNLPAQDLAASLDSLSSQSHVHLLYSPDAVKGINAHEVSGKMSPEEALSKLLQGSGFIYLKTDGGIVIKPAPPSSEPQAESSFDAITITGTRVPTTTFDSPAAVTTVTRKQLDDLQASTLQDGLSTIPGLSFGGSPQPLGQIPMIRGFSGSDILITVDGARHDNDPIINYTSPLFIDPDMLKQVDVVRGPSATYGSGSLGGVMALQTIDASDILAPDATTGGRVKVGYRTANSQGSTNVTGAERSGGFDMLESLTYRNTRADNLPGEPYTTAGYGGQDYNGLLKANFAVNDLNKLTVSYQRYQNKDIGCVNYMGAADPTSCGMLTSSQGGPAISQWQNTDTQSEATATWSFHDQDKRLFDGFVRVYSTDYSQSQIPIPLNTTNYPSFTTYDLTTQGLEIKNTSSFTTGSLPNRATYGFEYHTDSFNQYYSPGNFPALGDVTAYGAYLQDEIHFSSDWTLTAAEREDSYMHGVLPADPGVAGAAPVPSGGGRKLSPSVTLQWQALPVVGLFAGYAESYRQPSAIEVGLGQPLSSVNAGNDPFGFAVVQNPNLQPAVNHEISEGMKFNFDDLLQTSDTLRAKLSFFNDSIDNFINSLATLVTCPVATCLQATNIPNVKKSGYEFESEYAWKRVSANLNYTHSRIDSMQLPSGFLASNVSPLSPPDKGTLYTRYRLPDDMSMYYLGQFVSAQNYDPVVGRQVAGYQLHGVGLTWDHKDYRMDLNVSNLFNTSYHAYYFNPTNWGLTTSPFQEGRSVNLSLSKRF